jgi:hypothetical protein
MISFRSIAGVFAVSVMLAGAVYAASTKTPDVSDALKQWEAAVESRNIDKVVSYYDKKAIMFPAFAIKPLTTRAQLTEYYRKVTSNPDVKVEITETHPRQFGNVALNSGLYTLSYTQEGESIVIPSRFSFTYILSGGKWVIVDHHSSKVPLEKQKQ